MAGPYLGTEVTNFAGSTPLVKVDPRDLGGRVRLAYFSWFSATVGPAVGEYVILTKLPLGARVVDMVAVFEAMSSGGATAGADFGVCDDILATNPAADFVSALNMDAAGFKKFDLVIDKLPSKTPYTAAKFVYAKVTGEAWATSKKVQGWVSYLVD